MSATIVNDTGLGQLGLKAGKWEIDPSHSLVEFSVRHMMVSKVKGRFDRFSGEITVGEDLDTSSVSAVIDASSINTNDAGRDQHLRNADFFDTDTYPTVEFASRSVRPHGSDWTVTGDLLLHGVSRPVELELELNGVGNDPYGGTRAGFSASTEINRRDYGVDISMPLDGGGVVVGDKVKVTLEIEAVYKG